MADAWFRLVPIGLSTLVVEILDGRAAHEVASGLRASGLRGLVDATSAYDSVGLYFESCPTDEEICDALQQCGLQARRQKRRHALPCCYELGPDTFDVCRELGLRPGELATIHASTVYTCFAIGFQPGFPYLGWLPERLAGLGRLQSPRVSVEPGSVAVAGRQTGVYPFAGPGGWLILGRTPLTIADPARMHFPIEPGDEVEFVPISRDDFVKLDGGLLE